MIDFSFINEVLVLLIDFIGIWLAILVYQQNPKGKLNKVFAFMTVLMLFWVNFAYFARIIGRDQIYLAELFLRIAWFVTPLFFTLLYLLVIYLLEKEKEYQFLSNTVLFSGVGMALITNFTNFIIKGIKFIDGNLAIIYGFGMWFFLGIGFFLICATLYPLFKEYSKFSQKEKRKIEYFLVGIFIFYLSNTIFNIILPSIFGIVRFYYLGDYSAIFLLGFTAYAIVKQELFGIKIVLTTLLVSLIAILLLLDAIVFTPQPWLQILKGFIFVIFLYFGYLLIKSVLLEIERREEIERISRAKSEFISIASHQLRTPLTVVKGYISMVLEGTYGKLGGKVKRPMENVYKSNERLIRLVNDLLSISRIEAGKMELKLEKISLGEIIKSVIDELKIKARKKNIYLKWERPKKALPKILIDRDKIRQVILNVIDNGIRYTNDGGVTIRLKVKNGRLTTVISDTGGGMAKHELSKLFESFSRGLTGSRLYTEGAGLGLYIARRFVEMHKGKIWAESKGSGKGSTFYIELPIK